MVKPQRPAPFDCGPIVDRAEAAIARVDRLLAEARPTGSPWVVPEHARSAPWEAPYSPKPPSDAPKPVPAVPAVLRPPTAAAGAPAYQTKAQSKAALDLAVTAVGTWSGKMRRELEADISALDVRMQVRCSTLDGRIATLEALLAVLVATKGKP